LLLLVALSFDPLVYFSRWAIATLAGYPVIPGQSPVPSVRAEQPIPPALDQLVLACLAKPPTERPQSARELSARLGEINGAGVWTEDRARE